MWLETDCMDRVTAVSEVEVLNSGWQKYEDEAPENYHDYVLVNGELVFDPLPIPEPEEPPKNELEELIDILLGGEE